MAGKTYIGTSGWNYKSWRHKCGWKSRFNGFVLGATGLEVKPLKPG